MENKEKSRIPDFLIRAAKTFMQAFISVLVLNIAAIMSHVVNWDFSDWKGWLAPILIAALSAGIAALWNFIIEKVNAKAKIHLFDAVKQEEVQELIESLVLHDGSWKDAAEELIEDKGSEEDTQEDIEEDEEDEEEEEEGDE